MISQTKVIIAGFAIISVIFLVLASLIIFDFNRRQFAELNSLYARREDLLLRQKEFGSIIAELNRTLEFSNLNNKRLAKTLENLTMDNANSQQQTVFITQPAPPSAPSVAPSSSPPPRVTRAS